jgi:hypothetical protein
MDAPRQGRNDAAAQPDRKSPQQQAFSRRIDCAPKPAGTEPQHGAGHGNGSHRARGEDA